MLIKNKMENQDIRRVKGLEKKIKELTGRHDSGWMGVCRERYLSAIRISPEHQAAAYIIDCRSWNDNDTGGVEYASYVGAYMDGEELASKLFVRTGGKSWRDYRVIDSARFDKSLVEVIAMGPSEKINNRRLFVFDFGKGSIDIREV